MNINYITTLLLLLSLNFAAISQTEKCASHTLLKEAIKQNPSLIEGLDQIEKQTNDFVKSALKDKSGVITIPVVVHVVYFNQWQNISNQQIHNQINALNREFSGQNPGRSKRWSQATTNTGIQFCLANRDPNGKYTTGITRKQTSLNGFYFNGNSTSYYEKYATHGTPAWPTDQYLNIWVCNIVSGAKNIAGYAQFPGGGGYWTDGITIDFQAFGSGGTATYPNHQGKVAVHEVGHWLNLRHIWGDGDCNYDDGVYDTPKSDGPNYGCATTYSCGTEDMVENFMDYSGDNCMSIFTKGQEYRMRAQLAYNGFRKKIPYSKGCSFSSPAPPNNTGGCTNVSVRVKLDNYGSESTWSILNNKGQVVSQGGPYQNGQSGQIKVKNICLPAGCYSFEMRDSYGDGHCCANGQGFYQVTLPGSSQSIVYGQLKSGYESKKFCIWDKSNLETTTEPVSISSPEISATIYPNPTNNILNISLSDAKQITSVKIVSLIGEVVLLKKNLLKNNLFQFDVSNLTNGGYIVEIQLTSNQTIRQRFVKHE